MACVTLKRPLDHAFSDPPGHASPHSRPPPTKRRRAAEHRFREKR